MEELKYKRCNGRLDWERYSYHKGNLFRCSKCNTVQTHNRVCVTQVEVIEEPQWRNRTGKFVKLSSMTVQHIKNCMKTIMRGSKNADHMLAFQTELRRRDLV